jgi:Phage capsid protein
MSDALKQLFTQQFSGGLELLLQQEESALRKCVTEGTYSGEGARFINQLGTFTSQKNLPRLSKVVPQNATHTSRWITPDDYDVSDYIEKTDYFRTNVDPSNEYVKAFAATFGRDIDAAIIAAMYSPVFFGKTLNAANTIAFPVAQQIAVNVGAGAPTGLNIAKLRAARKQLMRNNVNFAKETVYLGVSSAEHDNLLGEAEVASLEYNTKPVLVDGMVTRFMGFEIVFTELFADAAFLDSAGNRRIPVFCKSALHLGMWDAPVTTIDVIPEARNATLLQSKMTMNAARVEEGRLVEVKCVG